MAAIDPNLIPSPPTSGALHDSIAFAGVAIALNIIAFIVICARMYTRSYPVFRMTADDYVIFIAWVRLYCQG